MSRVTPSRLLGVFLLAIIWGLPLFTTPLQGRSLDPEVRVLTPNGGETINGIVLVEWEVINAPTETLRFQLDYWYWEFAEWTPIVSGITGTSYPWDTRTLERNGEYIIRVSLTSVTPAIRDESDNFFTVDNGALPRVQVYYPNGGETFGGSVLVTWSIRNPNDLAVEFAIYYWNNWEWLLLVGDYSSVSYSWDTTKLPDGTWYKIKLICYSELGVTEDTSDATFTIKNGEETIHAPSVHITHPNGGNTLSGDVVVRWIAEDPDNDTLTYSLRCWDGSNWISLVQNVQAMNWTWATLQYQNGTEYIMEVMASDGTYFVTDQSDSSFVVFHQPPVLDIRTPTVNTTEVVVSDTVWVNWTESNPANYQLTHGVDLWVQNQWLMLARNLTSPSFPWDTHLFPNGKGYILRVLTFFGTRFSEQITDPGFEILNQPRQQTVPTPLDEISMDKWIDTFEQGMDHWTASDPHENLTLHTTGEFAYEAHQALAWSSDLTEGQERYRIVQEGVNYDWQLYSYLGLWWYWTSTKEGAPIPEFQFQTMSGEVWQEPIAFFNQVAAPDTWNFVVIDISEIPTRDTIQTLMFAIDTGGTRFDEQITVYLDGIHLYDPPFVPVSPPIGKPPDVEITTPNGGETWNSIRTIQWFGADPDGGRLIYDVFYWNGTRWAPLAIHLYNTSYTWDLSRFPSRTDYQVMVLSFDGVDRGLDLSDDVFTIGGNPPIIEFLSPEGGETFQGNVTITWTGFDPDSRKLLFTLEYYHQENWTLLGTNLTETTFIWDTRTVENGHDYTLRLTADNGLLTIERDLDSALTLLNNFAPTVVVTYPSGGQEVQGIVEIQWNATDPNDAITSLNFTVSYYKNATYWEVLAANIQETHFYWNTSETEDLNWTVVRVSVTDGKLSALDDSLSFAIKNNVPIEPPLVITPSDTLILLKNIVFAIFVVFVLVAITALVRYSVRRFMKGLDAAEKEREEVQTRIRDLESSLKALDRTERTIRRTYPGGWGKTPGEINTRLEKVALEKPSVISYLEDRRQTSNYRLTVLSKLETMQEQARIVQSVISEKRKADVLIGEDDEVPFLITLEQSKRLTTLVMTPKAFIDDNRLKEVPLIMRDLYRAIKIIQVEQTDYDLDKSAFSEDQITGFTQDRELFLDKVETLQTIQQTDVQVLNYEKGKKLLREIIRIETDRRQNKRELAENKARLVELEDQLRGVDRRKQEKHQLDEDRKQLAQETHDTELQAKQEKTKREKQETRRKQQRGR